MPHKMMGQRPSTTLPRRERSNREPYIHFDIYGEPFETYRFEDLNLDPQARHFIDTRFIRHFDRQPFVNRRVTEISRPIRRDTMESRRGSVHDTNAPTFGRAMKRLHEQAGRAITIYTTCQEGFDGETGGIMKMATEKGLAEMWENYVNERRDPKLEIENSNDEEPLRETKGQLLDMDRDLNAALADALNSDWKIDGKNSRMAKARCGDAKRLQKKVETAKDLIMELLGQVWKGREHCIALRAEMEDLKTMLDPTTERNKTLFKSPAEVVDYDASMIGNDGGD